MTEQREQSDERPAVIVLPDEAGVAREAAERIVTGVRTALDANGTAHVVLTGGSSAVSLYSELAGAPWRTAVPWGEVHFWWGDDRFVPRDHPESNAGLAMRALFSDPETDEAGGIDADADKIHPIPTEEAIARGAGPDWAAQAYAAEIESALVARLIDGVPAFDVFLTGIGGDGHTMSIFPNSPALAHDAPLVIGVPAPTHIEPQLARVTMTARLLPAARSLIVMSSGGSKAAIMAAILGPERDPSRWPAQAAITPNSVWILDEAVAAGLPGS